MLISPYQDEVITLPAPVLLKEDSVHMTRTSLALGQPGEATLTSPDKPVQPAQQQVVSLTPPPALFQPMEYPSLHIFVCSQIL